jgi:hypothetical protein
MTERKICSGSFTVDGVYAYGSRYVAVGSMKCGELGCDFNGTLEARSYESEDEASDLLRIKAGSQALIRCELYGQWKGNPDSYGKEPPSKLLPVFLRE